MKNRGFMALIMAIALSFVISACGAKVEDNTPAELSVKAAPFGGYICGYENTETLVQISIFLPVDYELTNNEICRITFSGEGVELSTQDGSLSSRTLSKDERYEFSNFTSRVKLEQAGSYCVDTLNIYKWDDTVLTLKLGEIHFEVQPEPELESEALQMRTFWVNQLEPSVMRITFFNGAEQPAEIKSFSYPKDVCNGAEIEMYTDFDLSAKEEGLTVPPNEERTVLVHFDFTEEFLEDEGKFFYLLPFVEYQLGDTTVTMPAQTQATVVQTPFTEQVLETILN